MEWGKPWVCFKHLTMKLAYDFLCDNYISKENPLIVSQTSLKSTMYGAFVK